MSRLGLGRVTEAEVRRVVRVYRTYILAAQALGITDRWLRTLRGRYGVHRAEGLV